MMRCAAYFAKNDDLEIGFKTERTLQFGHVSKIPAPACRGDDDENLGDVIGGRDDKVNDDEERGGSTAVAEWREDIGWMDELSVD